MRLHTKYLFINTGRIIVILVLTVMSLSSNFACTMALTLLVLALLHTLADLIFGASDKFWFFPYLATTIDIGDATLACYITGINSVFFTVYLVTTAVSCVLVKTRQEEYSLAANIIFQSVMIMCVGHGLIPYMNIWSPESTLSMSHAAVVLVSGNLFNFFLYQIVRKLVNTNYDLLRNMLPEAIIERINNNENQIADYYESATIVFIDLVSFTASTSNMTPGEVVNGLEEKFSMIDAIVTNYGLEKLKTIGDGYMFCSGIPDRDEKHIEKAIHAALDIQEAISNTRGKSILDLTMRIGIAEGPVMAGVIGKKKYAYDVWGSTVNLASRIESSCTPGRICVSESIRRKAPKEIFVFEEFSRSLKGFGTVKVFEVSKNSNQ